MSNPNQSSQKISDDFVEIQPINEFEKIEPVPAKPTVDPEYVYWVRWRIPRVLFSKFVNSETDPITGDEGDGPLLAAIEEYERAKLGANNIPVRENRTPPADSDAQRYIKSNFDPPPPIEAPQYHPELSVPPTIGEGQSLPVYRVQCAVCRSINKGVDPPAHNCADYQL